MYFLLLICLSFLCGCDPKVENRGFCTELYEPNIIKIGKDNTDTVQEKLGSPSVIAPFPDKDGNKVWYYIAKKVETVSFYKPTTLSQFSLIVRFGKGNQVTSVEKVEEENQVDPSNNKTEIKGYKTGLLRDVFGNFSKNISKSKVN